MLPTFVLAADYTTHQCLATVRISQILFIMFQRIQMSDLEPVKAAR